MKYRSLGPNHYLIRLLKGEAVAATLIRFAQEHEISSGQVTAIGALENTELGFFDRDEKKYLTKRFPDVNELISLVGTVPWVDGSPFFHLHACLGGRDYEAVCGHFIEATVAITVEVTLIATDVRVERALDEDIGLNLLDI